NCSLRWLAGWVRERRELVGDAELLQCFQPASFSTSRLLSADLSALACGEQPSLWTGAEGSGGERHRKDLFQQHAGSWGKGPKLPARVFGSGLPLLSSPQVRLSFSARPYYSLHEMVEFTAEVPLPGTVYTWDFGDRGEQYTTSRTRAQHLYALPGTYVVTVKAQTGQRSLLRRAGVSVILPVASVGLECPTAVGAGERADTWIHVPRGTDLSVFWRVMMPSGQEILGEMLPGGYFSRVLVLLAGAAWIGLGDLGSLGSLRWVDGSPVNSFQNWGPSGRPEGKENCIQMHLFGSKGLWRSSRCSATSLFLCEMRAGGMAHPACRVSSEANLVTVDATVPKGDGSSCAFQVLLPREETHVNPNDIIGIQHSAEAGLFLQCLHHSSSPWRQSYISLVKDGWWEEDISGFTNPTWVDSVLCDIRVTFAYRTRSLATSPLLGGHSEPGTYTYMATVQNVVSSRQVDCTVKVQTRVSGLQIIHPTLVNGKLHVATKRGTLMVVKILSGCNAVAHWMAPVNKAGVPFEPTCPASIVPHVPACRKDNADTWFSSAVLLMEETRMETLNVLVSNKVSSQKLSVKIQSYDTIKGLRVMPPGPLRMLVDVSQVGYATPCSMRFYIHSKMCINSSRPGLTHCHRTAQTHFLSAFRWGFGDGSPAVENVLSPPYSAQLPRPDPQVERVQVLDRVAHTYTQPGDYLVTTEAVNKFDRVQQVAKVRAVIPITTVAILVTPTYPLVNEVICFEAQPYPTPYGIIYSWDFSDGSPTQEGMNSLVSHSFGKSGVYNVILRANNSLSEVQSGVAVMVSDRCMGLHLASSGPTELGLATVINVTLDSGTDVWWSFNMGDGSIYSNLSLGIISHTFPMEGNYTVMVTAHNVASSAHVSTVAEIYRLQITNILAPICLPSGEITQFQAVVTGPGKGVQFCWDFQDSSTPLVRHGDPTVLHSYPAPGTYQVNLTVLGTVSTASRQMSICVEDRIHSVTLTALTLAVALGEPLSFQAEVIPAPDLQHQYQYHWDFGIGEEPVPSRSPEITFTYLESGSYQVTVTVWNKVSRQNASVDITAQRVVGTITIHHSGETGNFLALATSYLFTAEVPVDIVATFVWDFGDRSPPQVGQSTSHTYLTAGDITVTLNGENQVSRRNASLALAVLTPVRLLAMSPQQPVGEAGQEVTFEVSLAAGDHVHYFWAVGEPCDFEEGAATFSHIFPSTGIFLVFVTAENSVSAEKANVTIEIQERVQGVQIHSKNVVQGRYVAAAEPFMVTAEVTQGSNISFWWTVSQGLHQMLAARGQSLMFCYNKSGELLVELRAANALGEVSGSLPLEVVERIYGVRVHTATDSVAVGKPVNLTVLVTSGTGLLYSWHVQDRVQPLLTNFSSLSYTFSTLGSKLVLVTVSNVLGSSNGSTELRVQEPVSGVTFTVEGTTLPFFLKSDTSTQFWGSAATGSDITWEWQLHSKEEKQIFHGQNISCRFKVAGVYQVALRAWNDINEEAASYPVSVQDPVAGLTMEVDREGVCTDDRVFFRLHTLKGTNVTFALDFPTLGFSLDVPGGVHRSSFPVAGYHPVLASAFNNVSLQTASIVVHAVEKVRGLHLLDCCPAVLEANKELVLTAVVRAGENVTFFWTFCLPGYPDYKAAGQQVGYMPPREGNLTIRVEASNPFCAASLRVTVPLQMPIEAATLTTNGTQAFVNQTVMFNVLAVGGSDLRLKWDFGDLQETLDGGRDWRAFHQFSQPGDFSVEVKVYNDVSSVLAQVTVTVQELECDSPVLRLMEPPATIPKSRPSYFEASVDLKGCTAYRARYRWEVFRSPGCQRLDEASLVPLHHVDVLTPSLILPKLSLDIGPHCLRFTASLQHTPLAQALSLDITVIPSKLVPVIRGGSWRSWSAQLDLVLDGSSSYDPDMGMDGDTSLQYHWTCELQVGKRNQKAFCSVSYGLLFNGPCFLWWVASNLCLQVWIEPGQILPVSIDCRSCSALASYEVSRSIHVTLFGQCESCDNRTMYKWTSQSSDGQRLTLDNVTTSTGDSNRDLVIRQGVLRDGVNYTFTVSVFQPGGQLQGRSSITLTPNHPPRGGLCMLRPEHDLYLLETPVSYHCTGWVDEDSSPVQLIYTLIAETCPSDGRRCWQFCLYRGVKSSFSAFLPASANGSQSMVNVLVELEDSQGAKTLALNRTLTLRMPHLPSGSLTITTWLKNKSQSELWGMVQQGNPQEVIPYSLALITVLNQVREELRDRISIRSNVTMAVASLNISSVKDVAQLSAALQQCVVGPTFAFCLCSMLFTLRNGDVGLRKKRVMGGKPLTCAISFPGSLLSALDGAPHPHLSGVSGLSVALSAFNLTCALMKSLMRSRVLNEETLLLSVSEIHMQGKRANSPNLLCVAPAEHCLFSLPGAVAGQLAGSQEVVQVLMDISINPFPFNYYANSSISTHLALLEFTTPEGAPIPVYNLSGEAAIGLRLPMEQQELQSSPPTLILIPPGESVNLTVKATAGRSAAGVHLHMTVTVQEGESQEREPSVHLYGHHMPFPSEWHYAWKEEMIFPGGLEGDSSREVTILLSSPTLWDYHVNITNLFSRAPVTAAITVFASLCQYFHFPSMQWSTEGVTPTAATSQKEIVCLTEHLTVFGASLFVPPHTVVGAIDERSRQAPLVVITCCVLLSIYLVMVLIAHKLDDIDITRVGIIPRCGQPGRYKYWVMVKTGWKRGSGTTAHIGISLYGLNKSGSRHLDKGWAFQRNSHDIFQVETNANLGEIWKIRIWHDNTGLDPSWYLQHVIVWDRQTDNMYFFLVDDWLSVENEKNEGMVEKVVLAELRSFSRVFLAQLRLGFSDWHVWLSVWGRPPRSRFTRVQRITCCLLAACLFLAACVLWYSAIGVEGSRWVPGQSCSSQAGSRSQLVSFPAGVSRRPPEWLFPGWMLPVAYAFIFMLVAGCFTIVILYGSSLQDPAALMWLISSVFSFITSFVVLEPLKVVLEALRAALITKPVESEGEGLVEEPLVKPVPECIGKVRVPCGYGLLQAKEEARKVRALGLNSPVYLVTPLSCSPTDTWEWIDSVVLNYLYSNPRLILVGAPRLRQESPILHVPLDLRGSAGNSPEVLPGTKIGLDRDDPGSGWGFWIWGHVGLYHSNAGCWRELGNSSAKAQRTLGDLQASNWIHERSRAVFLEFTQYNADVNLYVAVVLLVEFPSVRPAVSSAIILPFQMLSLGTSLDLPLISLLLFSVAFLLSELSLLSWEGASLLWQSHCGLQLLLALLSLTVGALHFARIWLAEVQLQHYWDHRQAFTSFYEVAVLAQMEVNLSALLLTIAMLKVGECMETCVARWGHISKNPRHPFPSASASASPPLTLPCAFHALLSALHGNMAFQSLIQDFPILGAAYVLSYVVSLLCISSRFLCAIILHSYRSVRAEMYRPAIEPQDYEMIEFFVKRFKLWMGLSKTKEFRHKVKFEGMDSLLSHSSGNSKRSRLPSAGTVIRYASSTISSGSLSSEELALPESPAPEPCKVEFYLERLPSALNNLLDQFDRVIRVMEDVCQLESGLEQAQKRIVKKKGQAEKVSLAPGKQLELPSACSTFSESALARLRVHRTKISTCNATDGYKPCLQPPAEAMPRQGAGPKSWLGDAPVSTDPNQRPLHAPGPLFKWQPKSEEGQGCLYPDIPPRQIPLKRSAWQTEGPGDT
uniref:Polycystin 1, transient receptor potential channel interacting n=1 Tax=Crocodylus porosus TaxID=8502 RepID=A0A7M4E2W2_CROPO